MWRRHHDPDPQMGYQAYPEPTMDERYLETIPEVESLYSRPNSVAVAVAGLPELPVRTVPPMDDAESVYSTDPVSPVSPTFNKASAFTHPHPLRPTSLGLGNVSPISEHSSFNANGSDGSLVSPIEPTFPSAATPPSTQPHAHAHAHATKSHIPRRLPRPAADENIPKRWSLRQTKDGQTRWDEYSGEPNESGKPSSVRPGDAPRLGQVHPQLKERTLQILASVKEREAVKKSAWGRVPPAVGGADDPLDNPVHRPPWKGASGRHAIVEPVKNTPSNRPRPLKLVERHRKTEEGPTPPAPASPPTERAGPQSPIDAVSAAASTLPSLKSAPSEESIKPVAPLKGKNTPRVMSPTPHAIMARALDSPFQSPGPRGATTQREPPREPEPVAATPPGRPPVVLPTPAVDTGRIHGAESPTLGSTADLESPERRPSEGSVEATTPMAMALTPPPHPSTMHREADTTSSWTTYATSTGDPGGFTHPPQSPISGTRTTHSPVSMASDTQQSSLVPDPIVLRKRAPAHNNMGTPVEHLHDIPNSSPISPYATLAARKSSTSVLRKAVGMNPPHSAKPRAISLMSTLSISKSLPPTPVELEAADKLSSLEARLDDLSRRKRNVNKIILELHDSLRRNAIVYDARKRKEVDKMIVNLNLELQDIANEEHETSLRMHRVQKRRDKEDFYEQPTGLWVKRVTS